MGQVSQVRGRATKITRHDGKITVRYHSTDVVVFDEKAITLNSGGWLTVTTKTRMNQASRQFDLGYHVFQKNSDWFVDYNGKTIPFEDGLTIDISGAAVPDVLDESVSLYLWRA